MEWTLQDIINQDRTKLNITPLPYTIGRHLGACLCLRHHSISKQHAVITIVNDAPFITDMSMNGVFVNNIRIPKQKTHPLKHNDVISLSLSDEQRLEAKNNDGCFVYKVLKEENDEDMPLTQLVHTNSLNGAARTRGELNPCANAIKPNPEGASAVNRVDIPGISNNETFDCDIDEQKEVVPNLNDSDCILVQPEPEVIVINDEEEEFLFSQLFIKKEIKQEVDADFIKIKQEVAELDEFNTEYEIGPIVIEDSESDATEDDEFLLRLKHYTLDVEYVGTVESRSPEILFEDVGDVPVPGTSGNEADKTAHAPEPAPDKSSKTKRDKTNKNLSELAEQLSRKYKTSAPAVIPPKSLATKRKGKEKANKNESDKKAVTSTSTSRKRKRKTGENQPSDPRLRKTVAVSSNAPSTSSDKQVPPMQLYKIPWKTNEARPAEHAATSNPIGHPPPPSVPKSAAPQSIPPRVESHATPARAAGRPAFANKLPVTEMILQNMSFVSRLFSWEQSFFAAGADVDITAFWHKIDRAPMTKMPVFYSDYRYYQSAMNSIVMSELFTDVHRRYVAVSHEARDDVDGMSAMVTRVVRRDAFKEVECYLYTEKRLLGDYSLVNFLQKDAQIKMFFGIVSEVNLRRVAETEQINYNLKGRYKSISRNKLTFTIVTRASCDVRENNFIFLRSFGSIRRYFTKLMAVRRVQGEMAQHLLTGGRDRLTIEEFPLVGARTYFLPMNATQKRVVEQALRFCTICSPQRYFLLQGPPGTGKSDVLANVALNLLERLEAGELILLLAQSNAAVDNLARRFARMHDALPELRGRIRMLRMGQVGSVAPDVAKFHVDNQVDRNLRRELLEESPQLREDHRKLLESIAALRRKPHPTNDERALLNEKKRDYEMFVQNRCLQQYTRRKSLTRRRVIEKASILCSTIGSCHSLLLENVHVQYKCCIIDEATQATEPDTLVPLLFNVKKFILAGDTRQLPACNTLVPKDYDYTRSLFARLYQIIAANAAQNVLHSLDVQYRMTAEICAFPNRRFYAGRLSTCFLAPRTDIKHLAPYLVFEQCEGAKTQKYVNHNEIRTVLSILQTIATLRLTSALTVGILTPYNEQKQAFLEAIEGVSFHRYMRISVNTVDNFQGQEQDVVVLSLVLRLANRFVDDAQRLNVALTRARSCLYVVGAPLIFDSGDVLGDLKADAVRRRRFVSLPQAGIDGDRMQYHLFV